MELETIAITYNLPKVLRILACPHFLKIYFLKLENPCVFFKIKWRLAKFASGSIACLRMFSWSVSVDTAIKRVNSACS